MLKLAKRVVLLILLKERRVIEVFPRGIDIQNVGMAIPGRQKLSPEFFVLIEKMNLVLRMVLL